MQRTPTASRVLCAVGFAVWLTTGILWFADAVSGWITWLGNGVLMACGTLALRKMMKDKVDRDSPP
jgi:hypothetical protein